MIIAVIGAGIFGSTAAIKLKQAGHSVCLYEQHEDILQAASGINQYRLHRGYHYPRSKPTAISSASAEPLFKKEYASVLATSHDHYYAIAKEGSRVSGTQFLRFCDECGLGYTEVDLPVLNKDSVEIVIQAEEELVNPLKLREIIKRRLKENKVEMYLNTTADLSLRKQFDVVVNATYANLNFILGKKSKSHRIFQFELCEKPILRLPKTFQGKSIVVLDGPFMCIDPYDESGFHVMGNVIHSIHARNVGLFPEIPEKFKPFLNKGVIKNPPITNIKKFIESALYFMPGISEAEHIGSMFTVRTVLPNVDLTDERPTIIYRTNENIINIFSGKIGNSVQAAIETLEEVEKIKGEKESSR